MRSSLFHTDLYLEVGQRIKVFLNSHSNFLSASTVNSPRAVGDAISEILAEHFEAILGNKICKTYSSSFARRAMADLAFQDFEGLYYVVDVKTHRLGTKFNMPNLTSVERLAQFYQDDENVFVVLMIKYEIVGLQAAVQEVMFVPIEFLSWECLTIGALGWGQIQIANSNNVVLDTGNSRKQWMLELCDALLEFYPREVEKIDKRIDKFKKIRAEWEFRAD